MKNIISSEGKEISFGLNIAGIGTGKLCRILARSRSRGTGKE